MHSLLVNVRGTFFLLLAIAGFGVIFLSGCKEAAQPTATSPAGPVLISQIPFLITNSGSYMVSRDLTATNNGSGIIIRASGVEVDLNGKTLAGVPGSLAAISLAKGVTNVSVRNGTVANWGHNAVLAVFANHCEFSGLTILSNGTGLASGSNNKIIDCTALGNLAAGLSGFDNTKMTNCHARGNRDDGIVIGMGSVIENCTSTSNAVNGIYATQFGTIRNTLISHNRRAGILAGASSTIVGCQVSSNFREGIETGSGCTVTGNLVSSNTLNGIHVFGHSLVVSNKVIGNVRDGIRCGFNNRIFENECEGNALAGRDTGSIHAVLKQNRIEKNRITIGNATGIKTSASPNVVVQNLVIRRGNVGRSYDCKGGLPGEIFTRERNDTDSAVANYELSQIEKTD